VRNFRALVFFFALIPLTAAAQAGTDDEESSPGRWSEAEVKLPPFPKPGNLIKFAPSAATSNEFFIDPDSISVGADGVVRYALVVRSPGGAQNVSYEGIRCETREQKYYAFGRLDGTWVNVRSPQWKRIEYREVNRQHGVLYDDYLCRDRRRPRTAKEAINELKYGNVRPFEQSR
jgi:hypothetical protein